MLMNGERTGCDRDSTVRIDFCGGHQQINLGEQPLFAGTAGTVAEGLIERESRERNEHGQHDAGTERDAGVEGAHPDN